MNALFSADFLNNLKKGLFLRCPRCGKGKIFSGFLTLIETCSICHLKIAKNDNGDGPAVLLIFILGFSLVPLALWIDHIFSLPLWAHGLLWSVIGLILTIGCLRPAKAYVMALDYFHRSASWEETEEKEK